MANKESIPADETTPRETMAHWTPARSATYYWKCDRPGAFEPAPARRWNADWEALLREEVSRVFGGGEVVLTPACGQGNHRTFYADVEGSRKFVRVNDGAEGDQNLVVESLILDKVRAAGVPVPVAHHAGVGRGLPFAFQILEYIPCADLNRHDKAALDTARVFEEIGEAVARWQSVPVCGFGPFDPAVAAERGRLRGFHASYRHYFHLHLRRHLEFLTEKAFLAPSQAGAMEEAIHAHASCLDLAQGCLVHKDLALWNILGTADRIRVFIDWDDAISGDPLDDLSLLGCFYGGEVLASAFKGYARARSLPEDFQTRFWLHLLRNMIVKAVIRVGAGYFERGGDFFLIGPGATGEELRHFTLKRLLDAHAGLAGGRDIFEL